MNVSVIGPFDTFDTNAMEKLPLSPSHRVSSLVSNVGLAAMASLQSL